MPQKPPSPETKELPSDEVRRAIGKLEKRVADVKALDPNTVSSNDQRVTNVEQRIVATILEVFGPNSLEYRSNQYLEIWQGPRVIGMSPSHVQQSFAAGIPQTITLLEGLILSLQERIDDAPIGGTAKANAAFQNLSLPPRIFSVSASLFFFT